MASTTAAQVDIYDIADRLWESADELRANSGLKEAEYSIPVLGLIFLKFADSRFTEAEAELAGQGTGRREGRQGRLPGQGRAVPAGPGPVREPARAAGGRQHRPGHQRRHGGDRGREPELAGVLPRTYQALSNATLVKLLRTVNSILGDIDGDGFGKVYEYFLGKFAMAEGQKGGEYFTPTSIVRLIVEIIEPFNGKILDPACGSGGMFVQSARFVEEHRNGEPGRLSIYGQERVEETVQALQDEPRRPRARRRRSARRTATTRTRSRVRRPVRLRHGESAVQRQQDRQGEARRTTVDSRSGCRRSDNGNYIWIQLFYSALNDKGRAGFVMANSAADAGGSELEIRRS